jgi:hypothetical protein
MARFVGALSMLMLGMAVLPGQAASPLPPVVQRGLDHALAIGDTAAIGQLVGGNQMMGAEIVARAVTRRPDLAARIAAAAAGNLPQVAPQLAAAAAVASPPAGPDIAAAVSVAVPGAREAVADAIVETVAPKDRVATATRVRAAMAAVGFPSLDDPQ